MTAPHPHDDAAPAGSGDPLDQFSQCHAGILRHLHALGELPVLASAVAGDERERVRGIVDQLTSEHREVEAAWARLEPALKTAATGREAHVDADAVETLVRRYEAHAAFEEREFLPLSETILGRDGHHLAALGLSLHMRHAMPQALERFRGRI